MSSVRNIEKFGNVYCSLKNNDLYDIQEELNLQKGRTRPSFETQNFQGVQLWKSTQMVSILNLHREIIVNQQTVVKKNRSKLFSFEGFAEAPVHILSCGVYSLIEY